MSLFILSSNQKLIWDTINKAPQFEDLEKHINGSKEEWFKRMINNIYIKHQDRTLSMNDLRQLNKESISQMIFELKSATYTSVSNNNNTTIIPSTSTVTSSGSSFGSPLIEDKTASRNYMLDQKNSEINMKFQDRQSEFDDLIKRKPVKEIDFNESAVEDHPISNMDELVKQHIRDREYDVVETIQPNPYLGDVDKSISPNSPSKTIKWESNIETVSKSGYIEINVFNNFVQKTNLELNQLRNEIEILKNASNTKPNNKPTMDGLLSRLRKTSNAQ
jgi:hypothetical protein